MNEIIIEYVVDLKVILLTDSSLLLLHVLDSVLRSLIFNLCK